MRKPRKTLIAGIVALSIISPVAYAVYPVTDQALIAIVRAGFASTLTAITGMQTSLATLLSNIGMAINQNGSKVATTIEAASKSERDLNVELQRTGQVADARRAYQVSNSICSESASGGAATVSAGGSSAKGSMRPGGGATIANSAIANVLNKPALTPIADSARAAAVHAKFCDADDYAAFGGSSSCPSVNSSMPGADKRLDSVLTGAGVNGKAPELTFSQEQTDVARMYIQNTIRRSVGKALTKSEAQSTAGAQYIGMQTQLNGVLSAAASPQESALANRQPLAATKDLLQEALQSSSAASYFNDTASTQAKTTGMVSNAEFEQFEAGRRYANTAYEQDLQAMSGENLMREQIRVAAQTNWLLVSIKNQLVEGNIIAGQQLASKARTEFEPLLQEQYQAIGSKMGGVQ